MPGDTRQGCWLGSDTQRQWDSGRSHGSTEEQTQLPRELRSGLRSRPAHRRSLFLEVARRGILDHFRSALPPSKFRMVQTLPCAQAAAGGPGGWCWFPDMLEVQPLSRRMWVLTYCSSAGAAVDWTRDGCSGPRFCQPI